MRSPKPPRRVGRPDFDYDNDGQGIDFRQYQLAYDGPRVWFACSW